MSRTKFWGHLHYYRILATNVSQSAWKVLEVTLWAVTFKQVIFQLIPFVLGSSNLPWSTSKQSEFWATGKNLFRNTHYSARNTLLTIVPISLHDIFVLTILENIPTQISTKKWRSKWPKWISNFRWNFVNFKWPGVQSLFMQQDFSSWAIEPQ